MGESETRSGNRNREAERGLRSRVPHFVKSSIRKLLPKVVLDELQQFRSFEPAERSLYCRLRVSVALGAASKRNLRLPKARSVLFVCFGNIMRSPMCEALMNRAIQSGAHRPISASSAGLNATSGREVHPWAEVAARELGISLENHRARLLTREMTDAADVIFVMDFQNYVQLVLRFPSAKEKIGMLGAFAGPKPHHLEIRDPYYEGPEATSNCYAILATCIDNLLQELERNP